MISKLIRKILGKPSFSSKSYWESRYSAGGNSGDGSYGKLSEFKADYINGLISKHGIQTAIEFGVGDGNQLTLINYPSFVGIDISNTIIEKCKEKFQGDSSKSFYVYDASLPVLSQKFDISLSLDVLYHLVEEAVFVGYLKDLFKTSSKYVLVYSTNFLENETDHVYHREFTKYVESMFPEFKLIEITENPFYGYGQQKSRANFYLFEKNGQ